MFAFTWHIPLSCFRKFVLNLHKQTLKIQGFMPNVVASHVFSGKGIRQRHILSAIIDL